jgi:hypothetical protein
MITFHRKIGVGEDADRLLREAKKFISDEEKIWKKKSKKYERRVMYYEALPRRKRIFAFFPPFPDHRDWTLETAVREIIRRDLNRLTLDNFDCHPDSLFGNLGHFLDEPHLLKNKVLWLDEKTYGRLHVLHGMSKMLPV